MPWSGGGTAPPPLSSVPSTRTCVARPRRCDATCEAGAFSRRVPLTSSWWPAASARKSASRRCGAGAKVGEARGELYLTADAERVMEGHLAVGDVAGLLD